MAETDTMTAEKVDLKKILQSMRFESEVGEPVPMLQNDLQTVTTDVSDKDRFISGMAALLLNVGAETTRFDKGSVQELISRINSIVSDQVNEIIHHPKFRALEANWLSVDQLVKNTKFSSNIVLDFVDVTKEELAEDFENNAVDISGSALFKKLYVSEYDSFGGQPYGNIVGLYETNHTPADEFWIRTMGRISAACHAPYVGSVSPKFFGCQTMEELAAVKDLGGLMSHPKYGSWNTLRESEEAAYVGLTLPRYVARLPYDPETNPTGDFPFTEEVRGGNDEDYLWAPASMLLAQNIVRSFANSGWCQYLRGVKGGGLVSGLPVHAFNIRGEEEIKIPVEIAIPDYRELEFANAGFIPLIYRKNSADGCFFSTQSIKKAKKFKDPKDSENAQLVTNLCYTFSITRIAHYVKSFMRDNIGSTADAAYVTDQLNNWLFQYVTTVTNPDDLTLLYYPFKAASVSVVERPGSIGWYDAQISVLPHVQFEGMDVELKLDSRLG
jgi:type VI secretion system protein ImpC